MNPKTKNVLFAENVTVELNYFKNYDGVFSERTGYKIKLDTARTIKQAKEIIKTKKFDGLLLDMMMPENDDILKSLENVEIEREALWKKYNDIFEKSGPLDDRSELKKVRREIECKDQEISSILNDNGGIEIAKFYFNEQGAVPVIFFTARNDESFFSECILAIGEKSCSFVEKPATVEEVYTQFIKLWEGRS